MSQKNRTSLLLIEIILSVFFFAAAGAVCLEVFASAGSLSIRSRSASESAEAAGNIAEAFTAANGDAAVTLALIQEIYPAADLDDSGTIRIYLDSDFEPTEEEAAVYTASAAITGEDNGMQTALISVDKSNDSGEPLLSFTVEQYAGKEADR